MATPLTVLLSMVLSILCNLVQAVPRGAVVWGGSSKNREIVEPSFWENYSVPIWGWLLIAIPMVGIFVLCIALLLWAICTKLRKET